MPYPKIKNKKVRITYRCEEVIWERVKKIQSHLNLRSRENVLDLAINNLYDKIKNDERDK